MLGFDEATTLGEDVADGNELNIEGKGNLVVAGSVSDKRVQLKLERIFFFALMLECDKQVNCEVSYLYVSAASVKPSTSLSLNKKKKNPRCRE